MIEVWYDIYEGKHKKTETQSKTEAIASVLAHNASGRTKNWTYRLRREQVNPAVLLAAPSSYS
jgi:hypothetical protein